MRRQYSLRTTKPFIPLQNNTVLDTFHRLSGRICVQTFGSNGRILTKIANNIRGLATPSIALSPIFPKGTPLGRPERVRKFSARSHENVAPSTYARGSHIFINNLNKKTPQIVGPRPPIRRPNFSADKHITNPLIDSVYL